MPLWKVGHSCPAFQNSLSPSVPTCSGGQRPPSLGELHIMRAPLLPRGIALAALAVAAWSGLASADEPPAGDGNRVNLVVHLASDDAELQVQGAVTKTSGKTRRLVSP